MKKLLIGLWVLVVLLLNGCVPSSSPAPKVNLNAANDTKIRKDSKQCKTAKDIERINRGNVKQIAKIKGKKMQNYF